MIAPLINRLAAQWVVRACLLGALLLIWSPGSISRASAADVPSHQVLDLFSQAVFPSGELRAFARLVKWTDPLSLGVIGEELEEYLPFLQNLAAQLSTVDGLQVSVRKKGDINVFVVLSKNTFHDLRHKYSGYFATFFNTREDMEEYVREKEKRGINCFLRAFSDPAVTKLTTGFVVIDTGLPNPVLKKCIASNIMSLLGFKRTTKKLRSSDTASVLSENKSYIRFTEIDMAMIKLLYAKNIQSGMNYDETMKQARKNLGITD